MALARDVKKAATPGGFTAPLLVGEVDSGSHDADGDEIEVKLQGLLAPVGVNNVTLEVRDLPYLASDHAVAAIVILDVESPTLTAPPDVEVTTIPGRNISGPIELDRPFIEDNVGVVVTNNAPAGRVFSHDGNVHFNNMDDLNIAGDINTSDGHLEINNVKSVAITGDIAALGQVKVKSSGTIDGDVRASCPGSSRTRGRQDDGGVHARGYSRSRGGAREISSERREGKRGYHREEEVIHSMR